MPADNVVTTYLVDNSVLARVSRSERVAERLDLLTARGHVLATCALSLDEAGYSARSFEDLQPIRSRLKTGFGYLEQTDEVDRITAEIREALFREGKGRAAGVVDVQIAAVAVAHQAVVLHYDYDFEHIHDVFPDLQHAWVVPRGSVD